MLALPLHALLGNDPNPLFLVYLIPRCTPNLARARGTQDSEAKRESAHSILLGEPFPNRVHVAVGDGRVVLPSLHLCGSWKQLVEVSFPARGIGGRPQAVDSGPVKDCLDA